MDYLWLTILWFKIPVNFFVFMNEGHPACYLAHNTPDRFSFRIHRESCKWKPPGSTKFLKVVDTKFHVDNHRKRIQGCRSFLNVQAMNEIVMLILAQFCNRSSLVVHGLVRNEFSYKDLDSQ